MYMIRMYSPSISLSTWPNASKLYVNVHCKTYSLSG